MVLLLVGAAGIGLFLWMQDDTVEPVATAEAEPAEVAEVTSTPQDEPSADTGLAMWWDRAESALYDAFDGVADATEGDCGSLEYAVDDLKDLGSRPEAPIAAAYSSIIAALERAAAACEEGNAATVQGSATSARSHLKALKNAAHGYGLPPAPMLEDL